MSGARRAAPIVLFVLAAGACARAPQATRAAPPQVAPVAPTTSTAVTTPTTAAPTTAPPTTAAPPTTVPAVVRPVAAGDPVYLATQIVTAERAIRDPATPPAQLADMARLQQVAYRQLGVHPEWDAEVLAHVPADLQQVVTLNAAARRELRSMVATVSDMLPAWRIIEPLPADELLAYYREGQDATGVPWQYLAAINLVESAMGRIHGLSTAGAQGPMQFLPSTWATYGEGDINDPHAAILGAARYLAHNGGGSGNIDGALFNYNRDNRYVRAISDYAAIIAADPRAYYGYHGWDVCYFTVMGDVYLPVGYESAERIPVRDWLAQHG